MSSPSRRWLRRTASAAVCLCALWWLCGFVTVLVATRPANATIPSQPELHGRALVPVEARTEDGLLVRGCLARAAADDGRCVVLAAGVHGNRLAMRDRAGWYLAHGWSTLLVDLRGTGASDPAPISMGLFEARDLRAFRTWALQHGMVRVAVHGCSLGAAAIVFAGDVPWEFAVLESCYRDLDAALAARLWFVPWPAVAFWPLRACAEWQLGAPWSAWRPVDAIAELRCPTLILCGDRDQKVGADAAALLLARSGAARKAAVAIEGAGHEDLWARAPTECAAALAQFVP